MKRPPSRHFMQTCGLTAALLFVTALASAQDPHLSWAFGFGGTDGSNFARNTRHVIASDGSILTTGFFLGSVDLDNSANADLYTSAGSADLFVSKLNADGTTEWSIVLGNASENKPADVAVGPDGHVYITMKYSGTIDLDPGAGVVSVTSSGAGSDQKDLVVLHFAPDGSYLGHLEFPVTTYDYEHAELDVDPAGRLFLARNAESNRVWLHELDPSDLSILQSAEFGNFGVNGLCLASSMTTDSEGNLIVAGVFSYQASFDPGDSGSVTTGTATFDFFLVKFTSGFDYIFSHAWSTASNFESASDVCVDGQDNIFLCGEFTLSLDFDPGAGNTSLTSAGGTDAFIACFSSSGIFQWVRSVGAAGDDSARRVCTDADGACFAVCYIADDTDMDPGADTATLQINAASSAVLKLDAAGDFVYSRIFAMGNPVNQPVDINCDATGALFAAGSYSGAAMDVDPSTTILFLTSANGSSAFNLRWTHCTPSTATLTASACDSYSLNDVTYTSSGTYLQTLTNAAGTCDSLITLNLTIASTIVPSVVVTSSSLSICPGELAQFTAEINGGGVEPILTWQVNGVDVATGTVYLDNQLQSGDEVTCTLISDLECADPTTAISDAFVVSCFSGEDLFFFSEYVEGSSNNKALELYNPGADADMSEYSIELYTNGSSTPSSTLDLSGTLGAGQVLVIANAAADPAVLDLSDLTSGVCSFNGNDAVVLTYQGEPVDVIGVVGVNPGTNWPIPGGGATSEFTLLRIASADGPEVDWNIGQFEWTAFPQNFFGDLGTFTPTVLPTVTIDAALTEVCEGDMITFTASAENAGLNPQFTWFVNGVPSGATGTSWSTDLLQDGDEVMCVVTTSDEVEASSEGIVVVINDYPSDEINLSGNTLSVSAPNATIQWVDCANGFSPIDGQEGQEFIPAVNGSFGALIEENGCAVQTVCVDVIIDAVENEERIQIAVYPNPGDKVVHVRLNHHASIEVLDITGKILVQGDSSMVHRLDVRHLASGVYTIRTSDGMVMRWVKE